MFKKLSITLLGFLAIFFLIFGSSFIPYLFDWYKHPSLTWQIEGPIKDNNFRDLGASLNRCLASQQRPTYFQSGVLFRANRFFSGWACDTVGNPEQIYTLNFIPTLDQEYFCRSENGAVRVGQHFNINFEISEIENLQRWQQKEFREPLCRFIESILNNVARGQRTLIHCDAGRDRTGAMSALVAQALFESSPTAVQRLPKAELRQALECDFEKSRRLDRAHYGRVLKFFDDLEKQGGARVFLEQSCRFPGSLFDKAAGKFISFN